MSRVLVTGGAGVIGAAVVRRLLADPSYEVRVADSRAAPQWMREACEIRVADLRDPAHARGSVRGCTDVIHLAGIEGGSARLRRIPHTVVAVSEALTGALVDAALAQPLERFTYVSCGTVFERAEIFPTPEDYLPDCPTPRSSKGFAKLAGEARCRAAREQHGLRYTVCRVFNTYGPGELPGEEQGSAHLVADLVGKALADASPLPIIGSGAQTRTLTYVDDVAAGIVAAMSSPAGVAEDFNIAAGEELSVAEIARAVWAACDRDPAEFAIEPSEVSPEHAQRRWPSVQKARSLLGWEAQVPLEPGLAATVGWFREHAGPPEAPAGVRRKLAARR